MRIVQVPAIVSTLLLAASFVFGQEQPPTEVVSGKIVETLPPYWSVAGIKITASVNLGDRVEPKIKQRLEATVTPKADLFVEDTTTVGSFGPFTPILLTLKAGTVRTLYVVATLTYASGQWNIELKPESSVVELGKPVDLFTGPTLVRGSEDERTIVERLRAEAARQAKEALAAALDGLKAEHAAAVRTLRAVQQKELDELKTAQTAELQKLKGAFAAQKTDLTAQLEQLKRSHETEINALEEGQAQRRQQLAKGYEGGLADLKVQHEQELKKIEQEHRAAVEKLTAEIKAKEELIALEQEKQKRLNELAAAQRTTFENEAKRAEERQQAELTAQAAAAERRMKLLADIESRLSHKDPKVRLAALEAAMASNDPVVRTLGFDAVIKSDNDTLRSVALKSALKGPDDGLRERAVTYVFASKKQIGGQYTIVNPQKAGPPDSGAWSFHVTKTEMNGPSVNFEGKLTGAPFPDDARKSVIYGTVAGEALSAGNDYCNISAKLDASKGLLLGQMSCRQFYDRGGHLSGPFEIVISVY